MRLRAYAAALLVTATVAAPAMAGKVTEKMHVGEKPPDYLGRDIDGNDVLLSAEPGKVTVITFWATWCGPCLQEMPVLEAVQKLAGRDHLRVIAINFQEDRSTFKRVNKKLSNFTLTFSYDSSGKIARKFGINAIPHMYILNKRGEIAKIRVGYAEGYTQELADDLNALLVEK